VCQITNAKTKDKDLNLVGLPIPIENVVDLQRSSAAVGVRYCSTEKACFNFSLCRWLRRVLHSNLRLAPAGCAALCVAAQGQAAAAVGVMPVSPKSLPAE